MSFTSRLELKWSQDKSISNVFTCFVCLLMMCSDWGLSLEEGVNFSVVYTVFCVDLTKFKYWLRQTTK